MNKHAQGLGCAIYDYVNQKRAEKQDLKRYRGHIQYKCHTKALVQTAKILNDSWL